MSRSVVISIRIPRELKDELDRLGIDYAEEVCEFLKRLVRVRRAEELIRQAEEIQRQSKRVRDNLSAKVIREDRDPR